jgi:Ca2+-binding EF-hand superfamily protein
MKLPLSFFAVVASLVISVNLAQADDEASVENPHSQHHGDMGRMVFDKLDTNGDGVISRKEFNAYNAKHFKELDINHDGKLTPEELQGGHSQGMGHGNVMGHSDGTTHLDQRFNAADVNHDGGLDREEAKEMPMLSQYFDEVDANKDGKVTRQEYFDAMPLLHGVKKIEPKQKSESM